MSKNFNETVRLQSAKRQEWIREIRGQRLQEIAEVTNSGSLLASSSAASFPGRNECPGTHFSLKEQEQIENSSARSARKIEVKGRWRRGQRGEDRLERESDKEEKGREVVDLLVLKKKGGLSATERAVGKCVKAAFAKRVRNKAVCVEHQIVRRAFSAREVKKQRHRKEKETSISLQKNNESQNKK